jgi:hypothetical protein
MIKERRDKLEDCILKNAPGVAFLEFLGFVTHTNWLFWLFGAIAAVFTIVILWLWSTTGNT